MVFRLVNTLLLFWLPTTRPNRAMGIPLPPTGYQNIITFPGVNLDVRGGWGEVANSTFKSKLSKEFLISLEKYAISLCNSYTRRGYYNNRKTMNENLDIAIIDFLDLMNVTLSTEFTEKWRHKYSEKFIKHFQLKLLDVMSAQKPIKLDTLYNYLTKKCKYSPEQVINFFDTVDIDLYRPVVYGKLTKQPIF